MKVSEAIEQLKQLPGDLEMMDEYGDRTIVRFICSSYGDECGNHACVMYEEDELP